MNIAEAKEYIKETVRMYLKKDEFGDYRIPVVRQRPIFMLGAPGIGKTAVLSQIASELDIALVSYSMTHHTRQSALGLPYIKEKSFDGVTYSVSEYTMSEIISSIYDTMENSGVKEGILFLDEINCVSETLYPSMLQFLQYKVFGKHTVPEGWVIVTAGNPPEFNKAVKEFDVVTLDRLKVLNVEADYPAWKKYAYDKGLHGAIMNFLESNREYFYVVETTAYGKTYVTARGWEDLSEIITLYEEDGKRVTDSLVSQYLSNETIVKEFVAYYELYNKYKKQYDVESIFAGNLKDSVIKAVSEAALDERLALTGLLMDKVTTEIKDVMRQATCIREMRAGVQKLVEAEGDAKAFFETLRALITGRENIIKTKSLAGSLSSSEKALNKKMIKMLKELGEQVQNGVSVKEFYNAEVMKLKDLTQSLQGRIDNLFKGMVSMFGEDGNELLVLVTELTLNSESAAFFAAFKNASYEKYNSLLMVGNRNENLRKEILELL